MSTDKKMAHFGPDGRARMVDVSEKPEIARIAIASGFIRMSTEALALVKSGAAKKGDAVAVAELAGVMAAKKAADITPLCHPLALSGVKIASEADVARSGVHVRAEVKPTGPTGVEMEALMAVSVACLTLYDMLKAVDRSMTISDIQLDEKSGGASGRYDRERSS